MATSVEMLRSMLGGTAHDALETLASTSEPLSGRQVAAAIGVAPTTATTALGKLREAGFATSNRVGRANHWHLDTENTVIRSWLKETHNEIAAITPEGTSPYSTGGGGVTFERKVAVQYLAHLLTGDGASEFGDGRFLVSVAFQQAPEHPVDDLVLCAARKDETEPSLVLAVGIRRSPNLVASDDSTRKLFRCFLQEILEAPINGPDYRIALVVAGTQTHAAELAVLTDLASDQTEALKFFELVNTPGKFASSIRGRLQQVEALVELALQDMGVIAPADDIVKQQTWELLCRLVVLMPRLESPDDADWGRVANRLTHIARGGDLYGSSRLRDRLLTLSDEYPTRAASVDLRLIQRDVHEFIDSTPRRHLQGWQALNHLHLQGVAVRSDITSADGNRTVHLDRSATAARLLEVARSASVVVAHGESGVGKSALVVQMAVDAAANDPDTTQVLCLNLRHLPSNTLDLESHLGSPMAMLLSDMTAPQRLLVIDGADAISEGMLETFRYIVHAAVQADVTIIAITANDTKQLVRDSVVERGGRNVAEFGISPLTDSDLDKIVAGFGGLATLAINPRARELLRRPVVVDLLVRGGLGKVPLSDADAMEQVWSGLVRRHEQTDRGMPDAREFALLQLADLALRNADPLAVMGSIDPVALDGLRHDGILRTSVEDPFQIGPEFTHDELRRYALARLILGSGSITSKLVEGGVPRWSLGAARLACQALLAGSGSTSQPQPGAFARLQRQFDDLVEAGHGERWSDVPCEALLALGDSGPALRDAWPELCADAGSNLKRLTRLVGQRLRDENGLVRVAAVEPLVDLVLRDDKPWSEDILLDLLRDWLRSLAAADTPSGHPLRIVLRDRLLAACAAADQRAQLEREAAATARAAQPAEDTEVKSRLEDLDPDLFTEIGYPRRRRPPRPDVPPEITSETMIELFALLGADLGDEGEATLRRVAEGYPWQLGPAVEELLTGRALAAYGRGFLAEIAESYYLDLEEVGSGFHDDGIRRHNSRSLGFMPLAAWYRGPFMPLFQSDFRNGVAVLNRLLNHAALVRARTLAAHQQYGMAIDDSALDSYRTELDVTGITRTYIGDGSVWSWYRGTGVGPYPCMSALQALERVCDQLVDLGIPLRNVVAILLEDCTNLAMVGLAVGLIVRHLEDADRLLDPYLADPIVWHLEFGRIVHEDSGLAASSDGISNPERRRWSLREAAMVLALAADESRQEDLKSIGRQLVDNAREQLLQNVVDSPDEAEIDRLLAAERAWASGLDKATYEVRESADGIYVQSRPPDSIVEALQQGNEDLQRAQAATRLLVRYLIQPKQRTGEPLRAEEITSDLVIARDLFENPPAMNPSGQWDVPTAVAAAAIDAHLLVGMKLPIESLRFAMELVLRVGLGEPPDRQFDFEESYFEHGYDRSAAFVLPLLLLPAAAALRGTLDPTDASLLYSRTVSAARNLARSNVREVRTRLAQGLDRIWESPCVDEDPCHHEMGLDLAIESMRDCVMKEWNPETQSREIVEISDPIEQALADLTGSDCYFSRFDAAIRALAPAAHAGICVSTRAHDFLLLLLAAHRRALLSHNQDMDSRGTHALIAARALLTITADRDEGLILEHIDFYADNSGLLGSFLRALSAAAEESSSRAATAARIWPSVVEHVIQLAETGHAVFSGHYDGEYTMTSLLPNATGEPGYLYLEFDADPISWWQPSLWQSTVDRWLKMGKGSARCVDQLIGFLRPLTLNEQVRIGLSWIQNLVLTGPDEIANRSYLLSTWLVDAREAASDAGLELEWQRVVDALVVAGATRLAPYSE